MTPTESVLPPSVQQVVREGDALTVTLQAIKTGQRENARRLVREALQTRPASDSIESYVVRAAMSRLAGVGHDEPAIDAPTPVHAHVADYIGLAWLAGQQGNDERAAALLGKVGQVWPSLHMNRNMSSRVVELWWGAVGNREPGEAGRLWIRAAELATTFGLETATVIRWTYAATFLPG